MGVPLQYKEDTISFRRKNSLKMKSILREVAQHNEAAIKEMVALMKSPDEKIRMAAAKFILEYQKDLEVIINTDDIQRMLLEMKNPDRVRGLIPEDDTPDVDFTTVMEIE